MSLEKRVERLESHFDSLDSAVRSLIKITGETHQIVLENQRENRIRFDQQDRRMEKMESSITALAEATHTGFERVDERLDQHDKRFDQLELLIRQLLPNSNN